MAKTDGRTLDHKALEHMRMLAVRRVLEDGEKPSLVMESFGFCRTTIYRWPPNAIRRTWIRGPFPPPPASARHPAARLASYVCDFPPVAAPRRDPPSAPPGSCRRRPALPPPAATHRSAY